MPASKEVRLRKIQTFGRYARGACSAILVFVTALAAPWGFYNILSGPRGQRFVIDLGLMTFNADQISSLSLKVWLAIVVALSLFIFLRMVWLLRGVFDNLAHGEVYVPANVQRVRSVGWLMFTGACLQLATPLVSIVLMSTHVIGDDPSNHFSFSVSAGSLSGFATAGIVILVSWIMDIGLSVSEEAAELRRDAELVV